MSSPPPPVIFKRKTTKPATRTRQTSPPAEIGAADAETENSPSTLAIKLKNKIKKTSKTKSRLSFGGDDNEDEVPGFKFSSKIDAYHYCFCGWGVGWGWGGFQGQKIEFEQEDGAWDTSCVGFFSFSSSVLLCLTMAGCFFFWCRIMPQSLDQATISTSNGGPRYDAAYLKELKASTPTSRPPLPTNVDPYDADMSMDIGDMSVQTIDMDVGTRAASFIGVYELTITKKN